MQKKGRLIRFINPQFKLRKGIYMKEFYKKVDMRSRKAMSEFLNSHFRYSTMNSWNSSSSYANNVKIYKLGLSREDENKLYELIELTEFYDRISCIIEQFAIKHNYLWQIGFNGRSSGYLVLYKGYSKPSEYKSYCTSCGQRNFKTIEETGNCKCGRCVREDRVNFSVPPREIGVYPGKGTDMNEDFSEWDIYSLKRRVELVQDFDSTCDKILKEVKTIIDNYEIADELVYIPQTRRFLKEVS